MNGKMVSESSRSEFQPVEKERINDQLFSKAVEALTRELNGQGVQIELEGNKMILHVHEERPIEIEIKSVKANPYWVLGDGSQEAEEMQADLVEFKPENP